MSLSTDDRFREVAKDKKIALHRYEEQKRILEKNGEDRSALHKRCDKTLDIVTDANNQITQKVSSNYKELHDFVSSVDKMVQSSVRRMDS